MARVEGQSPKGAEERAGGFDAPARLALRSLLLAAQIAICTLLVTASLVAVRSMTRALDGVSGIRPHGVS